MRKASMFGLDCLWQSFIIPTAPAQANAKTLVNEQSKDIESLPFSRTPRPEAMHHDQQWDRFLLPPQHRKAAKSCWLPPDAAVPTPACPLCSHTVPWLVWAPHSLTDTMNQSNKSSVIPTGLPLTGRGQEMHLEPSAELTSPVTTPKVHVCTLFKLKRIWDGCASRAARAITSSSVACNLRLAQLFTNRTSVHSLKRCFKTDLIRPAQAPIWILSALWLPFT